MMFGELVKSWSVITSMLVLLLGISIVNAGPRALVLGNESQLYSGDDTLFSADDVLPRMGGALTFSMFKPGFSNHREWYDLYFTHGDRPLVQGSYWWYLYRGPVFVSVYGSLGFWQEYGKCKRCLDAQGAIIDCLKTDDVVSYTSGNDPNSLNLIPLSLAVEVKGAWFKQELGVPLVPYVRGSLLYTLWWVWAGGSLARKASGDPGIGGVFGLGASAGLMLNVDFIDRITAREAYRTWGLMDSYLYFEYSWTAQQSFSSSKMDLSGQYWTIGIAVDF